MNNRITANLALRMRWKMSNYIVTWNDWTDKVEFVFTVPVLECLFSMLGNRGFFPDIKHIL